MPDNLTVETTAATIKVTKTKKSYAKLRKGEFISRPSRLDSEMMTESLKEFRGFFVLFWIVVCITLADTVFVQFRKEGRLRLSLIPVLSKDLLIFALSDLVMVCFTFTAPLLHYLVHYRIVPVAIGFVLQHMLQVVLIFGTVTWILQRDFPWPQSATLCLHSVSMLMKMHSYMSYNRELELAYRRLEVLKKEGGQLKKSDNSAYSPRLFQRKSVSAESPTEEQEWQSLDKELQKGQVRYPGNLTFWNFIMYLAYPTCVYELDYPRSPVIRWNYVVEKCLSFFGVMTLLYLMIEHTIMPTLERMQEISTAETVGHLLVPFMLGWLMIFYLIFECLCNTIAELTQFGDRMFYEAWWNSLSFDEFARTWNAPVHQFLLRHVYLEAIDKYKLSKTNATFLTFLFSSLLHEFVLAVIARRVVMMFFFMQMSQLVVIWLQRVSYIKRYPLIANALFWIGLMCGLPLTAIFYTRDAYLKSAAGSV